MIKNIKSFKLFFIIFLKNVYIYSSLDLKMFFKVLEHLRKLFRVKIIYMKIYYLSLGSDFSKCFEKHAIVHSIPPL